MGNKVNVSKLIEKKYKGNTLELNDILEEIDLVLNESDQSSYTSKIVRNGVSDSIPETLSPSLDIQRHVNNSLGTNGAPRNTRPDEPRYGKNVKVMPQSVPDKLAEAGDEISIGKTPQFKVLDLTSMITNTQMDVNHSDRGLINDIIANMGGKETDTWRDRIKLLRNYTDVLKTSKKVNEMNIDNAISSLMILNVLKKLSYFTAQAGKQFEYLMAPLIAPDAKVIGAEDKKIYDVEAGPDKYSLKFLKSDSPEVGGSYDGLEEFSKQNGGVKAVIGRVVGAGFIQFGEIFLTAGEGGIAWLKSNGYFPVGEDSRGQKKVVYFQTSVANKPKIAIFIKDTKNPTLSLDLDQFMSKPQGFVEPTVKRAPSVPRKQKEQSDILNLGVMKISNKDFLADIDKIRANSNTKDINSLNKAISTLEAKYSDLIGQDNIEQLKKTSPEQKQQILKKYAEDLNKIRSDAYKKLSAPPVSEAKTAASPPFSFSITDKLWKGYVIEKDLTLNLGDPEVFNKQMLDVSEEVNNHFSYISLIFNKAQELNINITRYFATSAQAQQAARKKEGDNRGYGRRAIDNANDISSTMQKVISIRRARG